MIDIWLYFMILQISMFVPNLATWEQTYLSVQFLMHSAHWPVTPALYSIK